MTGEEHRWAMRHLATGVVALTTRCQGRPHAMTMNAVLSVSTDPPTLLASVGVRARTHEILHHTGSYTVNVLARDQREQAERFAASAPMEADQFAGIRWRPTLATGNPLLLDSLVAFDCRVRRRIRLGDHTLFVGEVVEVIPARVAEPPLIFTGGGYVTAGP
ncbi:flavin reductase family protein [Actinomadura litoris]|uniref:Flavin reductase n=1 Tax=Actinomadura litoris TaxID=2678616 RepID=A0A7K1L1V4_9ACTN|nr:flavin reductase family protein [Actinomadura litoris]MUN38379.1 flavin reductase [Actinomadura litoris]